jgi:hypothetical protein
MYIGTKNGHIVAFNKTLEELAINAATKGITLDSVDETDENIVPYYNTPNDGIYYKESEIPPMPQSIVNERIRRRRRELYAEQSDPLTNNISVLHDAITQGDYETEEELVAIQAEISEIYEIRKSVREQIAAEHPLIA